MSSYRFYRKDVQRPPVQLEHVNLSLSFWEDHVDAEGELTLRLRKPSQSVVLDARDLELLEVRLEGSPAVGWRYEREQNRLVVPFPQLLQENAVVRIWARCRISPSDEILEGLYRDTTPPGCPQQYMSQCQQWGFQRIFPVIDDCTAKCTFRTSLEGDARYTHLISNGDPDRTLNPDGLPLLLPNGRKRITYVNPVPMAPYLFIACAGTWEEVSDSVVYPNGKVVHLAYLVPKGKGAGARIPLEILKRSILWQHQRLGYLYPFETYRTITMDKSNCGGMENVGNTTIITEAALVDESIEDDRLVYAYGVIVHEYEHNHCGSDVTMFSPFDMWLNEAYTVDVERQFLAACFQPDFLRLQEVDALRATGDGPFILEGVGAAPLIVREGFDNPDELIDGVTYDKAPEVLSMLRRLLGTDRYEEACARYFRRYKGGNATTEQFLGCFEEVFGGSLAPFTQEWLFTQGYPTLSFRKVYDAQQRRLTVSLEQQRTPAGRDVPFLFSVEMVPVSADGVDLAKREIVMRENRMEVVFDDVDEPAFLSVQRNGSFYGFVREETHHPEVWLKQALVDSNFFNRVEAMRQFVDALQGVVRTGTSQQVEMLKARWMQAISAICLDPSIPDGVKGYLLRVDDRPRACGLVDPARDARERGALRLLLARALPCAWVEEMLQSADALPMEKAVERRFLQKSILFALAERLRSGEQGAELLLWVYQTSRHITARLNALTALWKSGAPVADALLEEARASLKGSLGGWLGYLRVLGQTSRADLFQRVDQEAASSAFDWNHPGMVRALFLPVVRNDERIWTDEGLAWLERVMLKLAPKNEYTALRILATALTYPRPKEDADSMVGRFLHRLYRMLPASCQWVRKRIGERI